MFKTFIFGILSGAALAAGLLYAVPAVDQHREPSLVSVQANGGNTESFHVNLPEDRIVNGAAGANRTHPESLEWPEADILANSQIELFKIRNRNNVVVGVASRIAGRGAATGEIVEWTLHLPARGSLYMSLHPRPVEAGYRSGTLRAGTREFAAMSGSVNEHFRNSSAAAVTEGERAREFTGQIELVTALVGSRGDGK